MGLVFKALAAAYDKNEIETKSKGIFVERKYLFTAKATHAKMETDNKKTEGNTESILSVIC